MTIKRTIARMFGKYLRLIQIASPTDVDRIYRALLHRPPENSLMGVGVPTIDLALAVADSEERRRLVEKALLNRMASETGVVVSKTACGIMASYLSDQVIGAALRENGKFEEDHIDHAIKFIQRFNPAFERTVFVDIGANIGTHTIYALKNGFARAVCIEPDPANFKLLCVNQLLNDVSASCMNFNVAAAKAEGILDFENSGENFGDHRVVATADTGCDLYREQNRRRRQVQASSLDAILRQSGVSADAAGTLVWIDTQGFEANVFAGATGVLASSAPIVFELWPYGLARQAGYADLRAILAASGRRFVDLRKTSADGEAAIIDSVEALDQLHDQMLNLRAKNAAPSTDILLI